MTAERAIYGLTEIDKRKGRVIINGIRRGMTYARRLAADRARSRGVGRTVFGKKPGGLRALIKRLRVREVADGYAGGLQVKGLLALEEAGGRTKAHVIKPKLSRVMAFGLKGGGTGFARKVNHPGALMPAIPFLRQALEGATPRVIEEVNKGLQKLANELLPG